MEEWRLGAGLAGVDLSGAVINPPRITPALSFDVLPSVGKAMPAIRSRWNLGGMESLESLHEKALGMASCSNLAHGIVVFRLQPQPSDVCWTVNVHCGEAYNDQQQANDLPL